MAKTIAIIFKYFFIFIRTLVVRQIPVLMSSRFISGLVP
jgi:hypothetical protein